MRSCAGGGGTPLTLCDDAKGSGATTTRLGDERYALALPRLAWVASWNGSLATLNTVSLFGSPS